MNDTTTAPVSTTNDEDTAIQRQLFGYRPSKVYDMTPVSEAARLACEHAHDLTSAEDVPVSKLLGRVLAEDIMAPCNLPRVPTSVLDGFAVNSGYISRMQQRESEKLGKEVEEDDVVKKGIVLEFQGCTTAGHEDEMLPSPIVSLSEKSAFYVTTGSALPDGADAVIGIEQVRIEHENGVQQDNQLEEGPRGDCDVVNDEEETCCSTDVSSSTAAVAAAAANSSSIRVLPDTPLIGPGTYVRQPGSDIAKGTRVLRKGECVRAGEFGVLHALGIESALVTRRIRVGVFSTGDELVGSRHHHFRDSSKKKKKKKKKLPMDESPLSPSAVRDCNRPMLLALLEEIGCVVALDYGILPDEAAATKLKLCSTLTEDVDVIITTGGVSSGVADHIKPTLENLSGRNGLVFGALHLKPGKPACMAAVTAADGRKRLLFGLPGNPASVYAVFKLVVAPALRAASGGVQTNLPHVNVVTTTEMYPDSIRPQYVRARLFATGKANIIGEGEGSTVSSSGASSDVHHLVVEPTQPQQRSSNIASVAHANALVVVPPGAATIPAGSRLTALPMGLPFTGRPETCSDIASTINRQYTSREEDGGRKEETRDALGLTPAQREAAEAQSFRQLVEWLRMRTDVQNIDLMEMAGFCRNCLSKWLKASGDDILGSDAASSNDGCGTDAPSIDIAAAKEAVYGMPYGEWKKKYQTPLKPGQNPAAAHARAGGVKAESPAPKPCAGHLLDQNSASGGGNSAAPSPSLAQTAPGGEGVGVAAAAAAATTARTAADATVKPCAGHILQASSSSSSSSSVNSKKVVAGRVGVLTISDRAAAGVPGYTDTSGPALVQALGDLPVGPEIEWQMQGVLTATVPDETVEIRKIVRRWCDEECLDLVLTTGGTGFAPRDVTPEAVNQLLERQTPGLTARILSAGLEHTQYAVLSRTVCGLRGKTLIICLPGAERAALQALGAVDFALVRAVQLARGDKPMS